MGLLIWAVPRYVFHRFHDILYPYNYIRKRQATKNRYIASTRDFRTRASFLSGQGADPGLRLVLTYPTRPKMHAPSQVLVFTSVRVIRGRAGRTVQYGGLSAPGTFGMT